MTARKRAVAVVLAAGSSSRFGSDKLLHTFNGRPLGEHIAITLAEISLAARLAVCPVDNSARGDLFRSHGFEVIDNPHPEQGMGTSLALGAARAIELGADALLVCLADMPLVTREHIEALLAVNTQVVATESDEVRSPPVVFGRGMLEELRALTGDRGARHLLEVGVVVRASAEIVRDFDTPEDFA